MATLPGCGGVILAAAVVLSVCPVASAQPFNVRAWSAQGQAFVVWQMPSPPALPTDTVEIYVSDVAESSTANMTRTGRLFFPEYTGARLQQLQPNARLGIPTPSGGLYRLAVDEGVFAFTPRATGPMFFAVVEPGAAAVTALNSALTVVTYDPVNEPVRPHEQFSGTTPGGYPYTAYVVWADGRTDHDDARPDVPVLASAAKNGVPHVFTVTRPLAAPPPGALSCVFAMHGGEGEFQLFRPGVPARANLSLPLSDGIVVSPDDSVFANVEGVLGRTNSAWFGYTPEFDPFTSSARGPVSDSALVVNFTQRRIHWILDWLVSGQSPYTVDPQRVAMIGHSGGGRGTSQLTRWRPERFCAAVVYTPASDLSGEPDGRNNFLIGNWDQNLRTNLIGPGGTALGVSDVFTMTTRMSPTQRDFALTRYYYGKRDLEGAASWSPAQRAVMDALNDARSGAMIFWDEREHGVERWDDETNDATDGIPGPWPDIGQWIAPVRTYRASAQYLVDTYRAQQSYPGFFNSDEDPLAAARQPDPGPGDPNLGEPYGTWGGYLDWDTSTIVDTSDRWACTVFATGVSAVSIDNSPVAAITVDLAPRRVSAFIPAPGARVAWSATNVATNLTLQSGVSLAESDGLVVVPGLVVPRDPARVRVELDVLCDGDANGDSLVNAADLSVLLGQFGQGVAPGTGADFNGDGLVNGADLSVLLGQFGTAC